MQADNGFFYVPGSSGQENGVFINLTNVTRIYWDRTHTQMNVMFTTGDSVVVEGEMVAVLRRELEKRCVNNAHIEKS